MSKRRTKVTQKGQSARPTEVRHRLGDVAAATFGVVTPRQQPEDFKALRRLFEEETAAAVDFDHAPGIQRRTP